MSYSASTDLIFTEELLEEENDFKEEVACVALAFAIACFKAFKRRTRSSFVIALTDLLAETEAIVNTAGISF